MSDNLEADNTINEMVCDNTIIIENKYGKVAFTDDAIVCVIKKAIEKVDGVANLPVNSFIDSIANMVSGQKKFDKAISMQINEDTSIELEIKVNIKFGKNIQKVGEDVQNAVKKALNNYLSIKVNKIDVVIQDVEKSCEAESN